MAESKHRKKHKENLLKFKTKIKKMKQNQENLNARLPEIKSVPIWAPDAEIVVSGLEWEAVQNSMTAIQIAQQAAQSVMSRNIVNGVITMDFEKLNPQSLAYEPMTDEEKAPYLENFAKAIDNIKNPKPEPVIQQLEQPVILDSTGAPASADAKIIQM